MTKLQIKQKKSQELSINTIILAVLGLIILVVLVALLSGRLGGFSKGVGEVSSCEKFCGITDKTKSTPSDKDACENGRGEYMPGNFDDVNENQVCCCT